MEFTPKWIAWEITRRCNLRCVHCRSSSQLETDGHPDPPLPEAKRILEEIRGYADPVMVLSGGEPLLRPDVFEIAAHGTELGLRMCLATNGSLVTEAICREIKASGIKMVSLSLDGSTPEVHDDFRNQPGAFAGVMQAARLFNEHGISFLVNSSFTRRNRDEIGKVYPLVKSLGATAWYMFMIVPTGRGEEIMSELIPPDEYEAILNWHYDMEKDEQDLLVRPTCAPQYYRVVLQRSKAEGDRFRRRSLKFSTGGSKGCLAGQLICLIDVDGNILPCSYFPLSAGNLHDSSFQEIWEQSPLLRDLRDFSAYKDHCGGCEYLRVCGGCRARAYAMTGDYMAGEPFCTHRPPR
ncbi:MAG: radical SAM protein [Desulfobulbus sp.]|jgi:radical SAM protein with 4Fe4S-binding SPASM domain